MKSVCAWAAIAAGIVGCGGRQILTPADETDPSAPAAVVAPVDLTQAPTTLALTCDHGIGTIAFVDPCLVGFAFTSAASLGVHEVECQLSTSGHPLVWSFLVALDEVAQHPSTPLISPADFPRSPTSGAVVAVGGRMAGVSSVQGTVTFSRVDPSGRAFIAHLTGTVTWTEPSGATFSCAVDAPFWGAPGGFT